MIPATKILAASQNEAIRSFRRMSGSIPFYKRYLGSINVHPRRIKTGSDFKTLVPVLDKEKLFTANLNDIKEIFSGRSITGCRSILPNSGFSGKFSFGINTRKDCKSQEKNIDRMLHRLFDATRQKTLLVNALCMGIDIPTQRAVTVNTGPREDIVISIVRIFAKAFDQIIMVGDNCFIKNVLEGGRDEGIDWPALNVHIVMGGDSFPENFRIYLAHILGARSSRHKEGVIGSSYGTAELGLNILWETPKTIRLREKSDKDSRFMEELLGEKALFSPMLFHYNPLTVYMEEENGRLLFTTLNRNAKLPIIRYATGDMGHIIPYERFASVLKGAGLSDLLPQYQIPLVAVKGRSQYLDLDGLRVSPDFIKNILYGDLSLPAKTTGYFRMRKIDNRLTLDIQLKHGIEATTDLNNEFTNMFKKAIDKDVDLMLSPYHNFCYGLELNYERKFQYICQCP
jgi:phenylacetate-CoA ligase